MDNHTRKLSMDMGDAEIYAAVMQYRNEDIYVDELFMFCQSFNKEITFDEFLTALGPYYHGY